MFILGVDPGLANTGWGVIEYSGNHYRPVSYGTVTTKPDQDLQKRIYTIAEDLSEIAQKFGCTVVSMEEIFFTNNISSAISVAKVIGALMYKFASMGLPVYIYSPLQIKSAIVGIGKADKRQVQEMVKVLLHLKTIPKPDHAADALADCICYCTHHTFEDKFHD